MQRKFVTGLVTGALAAGIAGGIVAGVPALADNSDKPQQTRHAGHPGKPGGRGLGGALHGEFTAKDKDGKYVLRDVQRGQVTAVSASSLTVKSEDGTTWTWTLDADTRVARKEKISSIKTGDTVRVLGTRSGDTRTAKFVAERPANGQKGDRRGRHGGRPGW